MKKVFLLIALMFTMVISNAQSQSNVVTVDISKLSPSAQAELKKQEKNELITAKLEQYSEWAGMGQEIGVAVKEGLSALSTEVVNIADTDVGRFTMIIIAWKVIGSDAKVIIFGPILLILITLIFFYLRWKWYGIKRIKLSGAKAEGPIWNRTIIEPAKYEVINPNRGLEDDGNFIAGKAISTIVYGIFMLVIMLNILI